MRWQGRRASDNVDDRRGGGMGGKIALGGVGTLIVIVLTLVMGGSPSDVINVLSNQPTEQPVDTAGQSEQAQFVKVVLGDTEDVWNKLFEEQLHRQYEEPTLVLFSGSDQSGCGTASVATGPFYCPLDQKVYIDLTFYDELKQRFNAPGDFAMAYVVAHEVGHHVQKLLGTSDKVRQLQSGASQKEINALSVKLELQADFYAGVWAHYDQKMKDVLEPGDIEEALNAANAIGDDRLQKEANGTVVPDAFTHGTSEQRMYWFKKGYETGDIAQGDTFSSNE
ncbi:MAG: metalloprotease [Chitinophagaceae bacterium]|nr:metalloprotease [Chitinophagaceae bacterium]